MMPLELDILIQYKSNMYKRRYMYNLNKFATCILYVLQFAIIKTKKI